MGTSAANAPDIAGILQEAGQKTRDAVQQLWLMLLAEIKARKQSVTNVSGAATVDITFRPFQQEPPASDYAWLDTRNNHPFLTFEDAEHQYVMFTGRLSDGYGGNGLDVTLYITSTVTSGEHRFEVSFEALSGLDIDSDSFASAKTVDITVNGTNGVLSSGTISFSNSEIDSLAAGGLFRLKVLRDGDHANDDAAGNAQLHLVHIGETS